MNKPYRKHLLNLGAIAALAIGLVGCPAADTGGDTGTTGGTGEQASASLPGEGVQVVAGYSVLEEFFQTEIVNIGLEQLGYDIEDSKELEYATLHVDLGNGGISYTAVHWEKLHNEFFENAGGTEQMTRVGTVVDNVLQGYLIDKDTASEYGISSLEQLKDPEVAKLFDTDGNGKANLTGCNPGWGCELVIEHHLEEYGLAETVEHDQGQYFALMADTITRNEQDQPILYYTWTPLWVSGVLTPGEQVEWMEVPYTSLPNSDASEDATTVDGKNLGFAVDRQMVLANNEFLAENPAAQTFFELVSVPIDDVSAQNQLMREGEDTPEDVRRHAEQWISDNQADFDSWVEQAKQAAQ